MFKIFLSFAEKKFSVSCQVVQIQQQHGCKYIQNQGEEIKNEWFVFLQSKSLYSTGFLIREGEGLELCAEIGP